MVYFHGTNADLNIGDILIPGSQLGVNANHGRSDHVYLTTDLFGATYEEALREAYMWTRTACMVEEDENPDSDEVQAYVYIVEPVTPVEADNAEDVGVEAVRTSAAVIVGIVDGYDLLADYPLQYGKSYIFG